MSAHNTTARPAPGRRGRGANPAGRMALPHGVTWRRVHPISPLLEGWKAITAVLAILTVQNLDDLIRAVHYAKEHGFSPTGGTLIWILTGMAGALLLLTGVLVAQWWARSYAVDANGVYLRNGVLYKQLRQARLPRIQSVDIVHPLLGRFVGLGKLTVEVAGGRDSRIVIGYLRTNDLVRLRQEILDLAAGATTAQDAAHDADATTGATDAGGATTPPPSARPILGFEDATDTPLATAGSGAQEHPLYTVDSGILLGSIVRSGRTIAAVALTLVTAGAAIATAILTSRPWEALIALLPIIAIPTAFTSASWSAFNRGWGFNAAATPAGIRMRFGLTADTSVTLPPGRIHAVALRQSALWRRKDWWSAIVTVAGRERPDNSERASSTTALLPVGDRSTALQALWLVAPDLGTPDPDRLLAQALTGRDNEGVGPADAPAGSPQRGFIRLPRRAWIWAPLGWRRDAIAVTDTCVIIRAGRWWRRVSVVPYERIQSLKVTQGPFARRRRLARLSLDMVDRDVVTAISNLDAADAAQIHHLISKRALRRSKEEQLDRWLARAVSDSPPGQA
ncbi:PH domain-containing protein [Actinomyces oricola]